MSNIDHIFLYILLFASMVVFVYYVPKCKTLKDYLQAIIIPLLIFSVVEGCRYGRGADHLWYCERYVYYERMSLDMNQPLFWAYEAFLHKLNFNVIHYMILNAAIFFIGVCFFIKNTFNSKIGKWMYLFAFCSMLLKFETFVRQYLALPLLLVGISFFFKDRKVKNYVIAGICLMMALSVHSGILFCIPFIFVFYLFVKATIKPIYTIVFLFIVYYIIPNGLFARYFNDLIQNVTYIKALIVNENLFSYLDSTSDKSFVYAILAKAEQSIVTKFLQFLFECSVIVGGYMALNKKNNQKVLTFYNISILGFFLSRSFHGYELFARLFDQLYIFWFIPVGYMIYVYGFLKNRKYNKIYYSIVILSSYWLMYWGRWIFFNPDADYFWHHNLHF